MNHPRSFIAVIILAAAFAVSAHATLWHGTITQTVTETNDSKYTLGQVATGWYEYESDTVDGDFGLLTYMLFHDPSANPTLQGEVFVFPARHPESWYHMGEGAHGDETHMVVTNGKVSDFHKFMRVGATDWGMSLTEFHGVDRQTSNWIITNGTVQFSDPVAKVPDHSSTAALLFVSVIGLAICIPQVKRPIIIRLKY